MPRPAKPKLQIKSLARPGGLLGSLVLAAIVERLANYGLNEPWFVVAAVVIIVIVELFPHRQTLASTWLAAVPYILAGASVAVIIALSTKSLTQLVIALLYAAWRTWRLAVPNRQGSLNELLLLTAVVFEAIFLAAAVWRTPVWASLVTTWVVSYVLVYQNLWSRGDRMARILAATWGLIVVEVSWVFLNWLVTYDLPGDYLLIPQAALILTGLAYCFGGIYISQRQQALTRARLAEYLLIALLLVVIVASSTPWRGTL